MQGGQLATILEENAHRGELFVQEYATRLLRRVCVPLHTMIRHWIYRGELNDPHGDFFIVPRVSPSATPLAALAAAHAWSGSYELRTELLPSFIARPLADKILRAGKTINFLREVCGDTAWVQESAAAANFAQLEADQARTRCILYNVNDMMWSLRTFAVRQQCKHDAVLRQRFSTDLCIEVPHLGRVSIIHFVLTDAFVPAQATHTCLCRSILQKRCKRWWTPRARSWTRV